MGLNFCPLLQRGLCAIFTALLCPDRSPLVPPHSPDLFILLLLSPDHNRQILQHLIPREISTESFTHLLFLLCPLSSSLFPSALSPPLLLCIFLSLSLSIILLLLQVQSQSGES